MNELKSLSVAVPSLSPTLTAKYLKVVVTTMQVLCTTKYTLKQENYCLYWREPDDNGSGRDLAIVAVERQ